MQKQKYAESIILSKIRTKINKFKIHYFAALVMRLYLFAVIIAIFMASTVCKYLNIYIHLHQLNSCAHQSASAWKNMRYSLLEQDVRIDGAVRCNKYYEDAYKVLLQV